MESKAGSKSEGNFSEECAIIGGTNLDFCIRITERSIKSGKDLFPPSSFAGTLGDPIYAGVGRNISAALSQLQMDHAFLTSIRDSDLDAVEKERKCCAMYLAPDSEAVQSAKFIGVFNNIGEYLFSIVDMKKHESLSPDFIKNYLEKNRSLKTILMDANITAESMATILAFGKENSINIWFDLTDCRDCTKFLRAQKLSNAMQPVDLVATNRHELEAMYQQVNGGHTEWNTYEELASLLRQKLAHISQNFLIKLDEEGVLFVSSKEAMHFEASFNVEEITGNTLGCGDNLVATVLNMRHCRAADWERSIVAGLKVVENTMSADESLNPNLTSECISDDAVESFKSKVRISYF